MAKTKYRVTPGREDDVYIGTLPDGKGGLKDVQKRLGDMTQTELKAWKAWCPSTAPVIIVNPTPEQPKAKDNKPGEPLPVKPKSVEDEQKEWDSDESDTGQD